MVFHTRRLAGTWRRPMSLDLDRLPAEARDEIIRLRKMNASAAAYSKLLEGALLAAWKASEPHRTELQARPAADLDEHARQLKAAWEVVGEIVLRVPEQG
jgi:hypothetical protein